MIFISSYKKQLTKKLLARFSLVIYSLVLIGCINLSSGNLLYADQILNIKDQGIDRSKKSKKNKGLSLTGEQLQILLWVNFKHPEGIIIGSNNSEVDAELLMLSAKIYDNIARAYPDDYFSAMRAVETAILVGNKKIALKNVRRYINRTKLAGIKATNIEEFKNQSFKANFYGVLVGMTFLDKKILLDSVKSIANTTDKMDLVSQEQRLAGLFASTKHSFQQKADFIDSLYEDSTSSLWLDILVKGIGTDIGKYVAQLEDLVDKHPENQQLRLRLAEYYEQTHNISKAIENYVYLNNLPKKNLEVEVVIHRQLAIHYATIGDFHGALKHLKWLKLYVPKYRDWAYFYMGVLNFQESKYKIALQNFEEVNADSGYEYRTIFYQAYSYFKLKKYTDAQNYLQDLRLKMGDDLYQKLEFLSEVLVLESNIFVEIKKYNKAYIVLEEGLKKFRLNPSVRYSLSMLYVDQKKFEHAERHLQNLRKSGGDNAEILNTLGYILTDKLQRHKEALPLLIKANKLKPNRGHILDSLGWVYFNLKKYEEASTYLQKALKIHYAPEVISHYVKLLWKTGNILKARLLLSKGIKKFPQSEVLKEIKFNNHSSILSVPR